MSWLKFYPLQTAENTRVLKHSQLTSLSIDFDNGGNPYTIFIRPKNSSYDISVILSVQLLEDDISSNLPFLVNQWSPCVIQKISANPTILTLYDIYIGAGR
jgi:hypothetical protein